MPALEVPKRGPLGLCMEDKATEVTPKNTFAVHKAFAGPWSPDQIQYKSPSSTSMLQVQSPSSVLSLGARSSLALSIGKGVRETLSTPWGPE